MYINYYHSAVVGIFGAIIFAAFIFLSFCIFSPGPIKDTFQPIINLFSPDKADESKKYAQSLFLWTMRK